MHRAGEDLVSEHNKKALPDLRDGGLFLLLLQFMVHGKNVRERYAAERDQKHTNCIIEVPKNSMVVGG